MNTRELWSKLLIVVGGIAMVIGAIDPMEGSLLILPGSGLFVLGSYLGQAERRVIVCKAWAFILVAIGVGAMWGLSAVGGFGGSSGRSNWWAVLLLPYLIGWNVAVWGPGSPRWLLWLSIGNGLWYLTIAGFFLRRKGLEDSAAVIAIAAVGIVMLMGCIYRLKKRIEAA